jgi:hypothetical protein
VRVRGERGEEGLGTLEGGTVGIAKQFSVGPLAVVNHVEFHGLMLGT